MWRVIRSAPHKSDKPSATSDPEAGNSESNGEECDSRYCHDRPKSGCRNQTTRRCCSNDNDDGASELRRRFFVIPSFLSGIPCRAIRHVEAPALSNLRFGMLSPNTDLRTGLGESCTFLGWKLPDAQRPCTTDGTTPQAGLG